MRLLRSSQGHARKVIARTEATTLKQVTIAYENTK